MQILKKDFLIVACVLVFLAIDVNQLSILTSSCEFHRHVKDLRNTSSAVSANHALLYNLQN